MDKRAKFPGKGSSSEMTRGYLECLKNSKEATELAFSEGSMYSRWIETLRMSSKFHMSHHCKNCSLFPEVGRKILGMSGMTAIWCWLEKQPSNLLGWECGLGLRQEAEIHIKRWSKDPQKNQGKDDSVMGAHSESDVKVVRFRQYFRKDKK